MWFAVARELYICEGSSSRVPLRQFDTRVSCVERVETLKKGSAFPAPKQTS